MKREIHYSLNKDYLKKFFKSKQTISIFSFTAIFSLFVFYIYATTDGNISMADAPLSLDQTRELVDDLHGTLFDVDPQTFVFGFLFILYQFPLSNFFNQNTVLCQYETVVDYVISWLKHALVISFAYDLMFNIIYICALAYWHELNSYNIVQIIPGLLMQTLAYLLTCQVYFFFLLLVNNNYVAYCLTYLFTFFLWRYFARNELFYFYGFVVRWLHIREYTPAYWLEILIELILVVIFLIVSALILTKMDRPQALVRQGKNNE